MRAGIADLAKAVSDEGDLNQRVVNSRVANDEARQRLSGLIKRLSDILDKMQQGIDLNKLKEKLREIVAGGRTSEPQCSRRSTTS